MLYALKILRLFILKMPKIMLIEPVKLSEFLNLTQKISWNWVRVTWPNTLTMLNMVNWHIRASDALAKWPIWSSDELNRALSKWNLGHVMIFGGGLKKKSPLWRSDASAKWCGGMKLIIFYITSSLIFNITRLNWNKT